MSDGLHLVYIQYELGGYPAAAESRLDWKALRPYLRHDLPFRPRDLQSVNDGVVY